MAADVGNGSMEFTVVTAKRNKMNSKSESDGDGPPFKSMNKSDADYSVLSVDSVQTMKIIVKGRDMKMKHYHPTSTVNKCSIWQL